MSMLNNPDLCDIHDVNIMYIIEIKSIKCSENHK